jgi:hypothetical protein
MLRFFRQIRQRLITDNKFSKYLLYAIGEILLVVIGILIALQIDNWNEERKAEKQIDLLLINLADAINQDIDNLKKATILHEFRSNSLRYLLDFTEKPSDVSLIFPPLPKHKENEMWAGSYPDTLNMAFVRDAFHYSGVNMNVVIDKNVLDELKSTGLYSSIKNEALKTRMDQYYSFVNKYFLNDDWNDILTVAWREFMRDTHGLLTIGVVNMNIDDPIALIQDNKPVQARIREMVGPAQYRSTNASEGISLAQEVIQEINNHLGLGKQNDHQNQTSQH